MKNFEQIGTEIGELVEIKNAAYGSSFARCGEFMRLFYPHGIPAEKLTDALLIVRVFDKMMRIATDRDALGESPWADIAGYGILGVHQHQPKEERAPWNGSADAKAARESSGANLSSSAQPAESSTATSASGKNGPAPTKQLDSTASAAASAPAATAMAPASASSGESLKPLVEALSRRAIEIHAGEGSGNDLGDAKDLIRALARVLNGESILSAFGPPGDWGYHSTIGRALAESYIRGAR